MAIVRHELLQLERNVISQRIRTVRQSREATGTTGPLFLAETYTDFVHSEKPLKRQIRYSWRKYTDKPSQRLQERREAA